MAPFCLLEQSRGLIHHSENVMGQLPLRGEPVKILQAVKRCSIFAYVGECQPARFVASDIAGPCTALTGRSKNAISTFCPREQDTFLRYQSQCL